MACQDRGWWPVLWPARAWADRPVSVASQCWAGGLVSRLARTKAGGWHIGPPGQGLVGWNRGLKLAARLTGFMLLELYSCQAH